MSNLKNPNHKTKSKSTNISLSMMTKKRMNIFEGRPYRFMFSFGNLHSYTHIGTNKSVNATNTILASFSFKFESLKFSEELSCKHLSWFALRWWRTAMTSWRSMASASSEEGPYLSREKGNFLPFSWKGKTSQAAKQAEEQLLSRIKLTIFPDFFFSWLFHWHKNRFKGNASFAQLLLYIVYFF